MDVVADRLETVRLVEFIVEREQLTALGIEQKEKTVHQAERLVVNVLQQYVRCKKLLPRQLWGFPIPPLVCGFGIRSQIGEETLAQFLQRRKDVAFEFVANFFSVAVAALRDSIQQRMASLIDLSKAATRK